MAEPEAGGTLIERCSLFRRVPWLPQDIVVGICLVLLWRSLYFIPWVWFENRLPHVTSAIIALLLETAFFLAYPIWVVC